MLHSQLDQLLEAMTESLKKNLGARILQMKFTQTSISHNMVYNSGNPYNLDILFTKNGRVQQISQPI